MLKNFSVKKIPLKYFSNLPYKTRDMHVHLQLILGLCQTRDCHPPTSKCQDCQDASLEPYNDRMTKLIQLSGSELEIFSRGN